MVPTRTLSARPREALVVVSTRVSRNLRRRVRLEAVRHGVSMERFIADALRGYLQRRGSRTSR